MDAGQEDGSAPVRFDISSRDGTGIAVWVSGAGPPVVLVHGSPSDHVTFDPLAAEMAPAMTTYAMDRRGNGASGDAPEFDLEREFDDVAAVVEAAAGRSGQAVVLFGHSYGAGCALGAGMRTDRVAGLVLYEPSLGLRYPDGAIEEIQSALAAGDRERALTFVLTTVLGMSTGDVEALRESPRWPRFLTSAPALGRECRAEAEWAYRPGQFDALGERAVVVTGSDTDPGLRATTDAAVGALPGCRVRILEGHGHLAYRVDPALVARLVLEEASGRDEASRREADER